MFDGERLTSFWPNCRHSAADWGRLPGTFLSSGDGELPEGRLFQSFSLFGIVKIQLVPALMYECARKDWGRVGNFFILLYFHFTLLCSAKK